MLESVAEGQVKREAQLRFKYQRLRVEDGECEASMGQRYQVSKEKERRGKGKGDDGERENYLRLQIISKCSVVTNGKKEKINGQSNHVGFCSL